MVSLFLQFCECDSQLLTLSPNAKKVISVSGVSVAVDVKVVRADFVTCANNGEMQTDDNSAQPVVLRGQWVSNSTLSWFDFRGGDHGLWASSLFDGRATPNWCCIVYVGPKRQRLETHCRHKKHSHCSQQISHCTNFPVTFISREDR